MQQCHLVIARKLRKRFRGDSAQERQCVDSDSLQHQVTPHPHISRHYVVYDMDVVTDSLNIMHQVRIVDQNDGGWMFYRIQVRFLDQFADEVGRGAHFGGAVIADTC